MTRHNTLNGKPLEEIRAITEAANDYNNSSWRYERPPGPAPSVKKGKTLEVCVVESKQDGDHIATMDPPTTLALLDALEDARGEVAGMDELVAMANRENDKLQAEVKRLERESKLFDAVRLQKTHLSDENFRLVDKCKKATARTETAEAAYNQAVVEGDIARRERDEAETLSQYLKGGISESIKLHMSGDPDNFDPAMTILCGLIGRTPLPDPEKSCTVADLTPREDPTPVDPGE